MLEFSACYFLNTTSPKSRPSNHFLQHSHALLSPLPSPLRHSGDVIKPAQCPPGTPAFPWQKDHGNIAVWEVGAIPPAAMLEYHYCVSSGQKLPKTGKVVFFLQNCNTDVERLDWRIIMLFKRYFYKQDVRRDCFVV